MSFFIRTTKISDAPTSRGMTTGTWSRQRRATDVCLCAISIGLKTERIFYRTHNETFRKEPRRLIEGHVMLADETHFHK